MGKGDVKNPETDDRVKHPEKYEDKKTDNNRKGGGSKGRYGRRSAPQGDPRQGNR